MKHKKQILKFLEDNQIMIDSLMPDEERKSFGGNGVVGLIVEDIKNQMKEGEIYGKIHGNPQRLSALQGLL